MRDFEFSKYPIEIVYETMFNGIEKILLEPNKIAIDSFSVVFTRPSAPKTVILIPMSRVFYIEQVQVGA